MSRNAVTIAGLLIFALCLAAAAQSPVQFGFGSADLSPVKFGGKKLPSWLNSEYAPIWNGINNYASCAALITGDASNRSFMTWIKVHRYTASNQIITQGSVPGFVFYMSSNSTYVVRFGLGTEYTITANNALQVGVWQHVAWTKTGTTGRLYIDGVLNTSFGLATTAATIPTTQTYMGSQNTTSQHSNVSLAELSIWNRALSADEILRYKDKRLRGTETGLVAYYPMNDNSQTLIDKVGGKNAIASNSITWTRRNPYPSGDIRAERYAISMDGVDDFAQTTASVGLLIPASTNAMSTELWFCPQTTAIESNKGIFCRYPTNADGNWGYFWSVTTGDLAHLVRQSAANKVAAPPYTKKAGWAHILSVIGTGAQTIYLDGVLATSTALATTTMPAASGAITLGGYLGGNYAKVKVCEAAVWSRALTPSEAAARPYIKLTGSETGLAAYWPCNEGAGVKLKNYSPLGTDADMSFAGAPTWVGRDIH